MTRARVALTALDADRIAAAVDAELAASTRETYACGWRQWERWCSGRGIQPRPALPEAIAAFLTERAEAGVHLTMLDCYCSGIAYRHRQEGLADPTADFLVRRVRRGLRRILGVAPIRQAHPLTVAELGQIVTAIDTDDAKDLRDRAFLLLGCASAMRPGEISALNVEDLQRKPTGVLISIRRSKTDPDAQGQLVGVARGDNRLTDPIRALDQWLKVRPPGPGALFTRVLYRRHPTSERIGPRAISRTVQERPTRPASTACQSPATHSAPDTPPPPQSTAPRSTASQRRPATATSAPCSTITSGPPRRWRPPRAATSGCEVRATARA
jgi:integrase